MLTFKDLIEGLMRGDHLIEEERCKRAGQRRTEVRHPGKEYSPKEWAARMLQPQAPRQTLKVSRQGLLNCSHCDELIPRGSGCKTCGASLEALQQCADCHDEIVHSQVHDQNVHITGNPFSSKLMSIDADEDAFGRAQ